MVASLMNIRRIISAADIFLVGGVYHKDYTHYFLEQYDEIELGLSQENVIICCIEDTSNHN